MSLSESIKETITANIYSIPGIDEQKKQHAVTNILTWLEAPRYAAYKPLLLALIDEKRWNLLLDCFYQTRPFGTGGRRGPIGIGPNRINPYMINSSVQGHCIFLRNKYPTESQLAVVIAYDVRNFKDAQGVYPRSVPNPLMGIGSRSLAQSAAEVYAGNGINAYILPDTAAHLISTPELSFLIRQLKAHGGINISASHNPPDDNGGKIYNRFGGQDIPPDDDLLASIVERVDEIKSIPFDEGLQKQLIRYIPDEVRNKYIDMNVQLTINPGARSARIAYTPLHGTGTATVARVLTKAGFDLHLVPSQASPDGDFPNVRFRIPNPEVPESMIQAEAYAKEIQADIVLATDPDADRIGMMAPDKQGNWLFYNGNQIAALIADYIVTTRAQNSTLPSQPVIVKTEVTSELVSAIGHSINATVVDDLLVGFKYIAEVIRCLESEPGGSKRFIFGAEESHGILITPEIRDKDAAGAALYLAELASMLKERRMSMDEQLRSLYRRYGYFGTNLVSIVMTGAIGMSKIAEIQSRLRKTPPQTIAGYSVTSFVDHFDENGRFGRFKSETDKSARNVLIIRLEKNIRIILRPSGTEPKIKVYFEYPTAPMDASFSERDVTARMLAVDKELAHLSDEFTLFVLKLIDVDLPHYALLISGLVSLDCKLNFVHEFLPLFAEKARLVLQGTLARDAASSWIDTYLTSQGYGKDPKGLVEKAFRKYLEETRLNASHELRELLTIMESVF